MRVSPRRFPWAYATTDGMVFGVTGAAGESVDVRVIAPGGMAAVRVVTLSFGATGGDAVVTCAGFDAAATCSESVV